MSTVIDNVIHFMGKVLAVYGNYNGLDVTYGKTSQGKTPLADIVKKIIGEHTTIELSNLYSGDFQIQNITFGEKGGVVIWGDGTYNIYEAGLQTITHEYVHFDSITLQIYGVTKFGDNAFDTNRTTSRSTFTVSTKAIELGNQCFKDNLLLEIVKAPLLTTIGTECFKGCTNLRNYDFPELRNLSEGCFQECNLEVASLPMKLEIVPKNCFKNCAYLKLVSLPNSCHTLDKNSFEDCSRLISIDSERVTRIEDEAFMNCYNLVTAEFYNAEYIGSRAFYETQITQLIFHIDVYCQDYAFSNMGNLKKVNLVKCRYIGSNCFTSCPDLESVVLPGYPPERTETSFNNVGDNVKFIVDVGAKEIYNNPEWADIYDRIVEE